MPAFERRVDPIQFDRLKTQGTPGTWLTSRKTTHPNEINQAGS